MNLKCKFKACFMVISVLFAGQGSQTVAATLSVPSATTAEQNVALFHQLDVLRSQNAVLAEALKNAELRNKIAAEDKTVPEPVRVSTTRPANNGSQAFAPLASSALVQMVSGVGSSLTTRISLPNGSEVNAVVGNHIPGLGVVHSISLNAVVIANKNKSFSLPFASHSSNAYGSSSASQSPQSLQSPQMPPLPPQSMMPGLR